MPKTPPLRRTAAAALLALSACAASGAERFWSYDPGCTTQDFASTFCWSDTPFHFGNTTAPGKGHDAYLLSFASATVGTRFANPQPSPLEVTLNSLSVLGSHPHAMAQLDIARGSLVVLEGLFVGRPMHSDRFQAGKGQVFQDGASTRVSAGKFVSIGDAAGGTGDYFLRGGALETYAPAPLIDTGHYISIGSGGVGMLEQTGGSLTTDAMYLGGGTDADVGGKGSYYLRGGTASVRRLVFWGNASVQPSKGVLALSGGTLVADQVTQYDSRHVGSAIINIDGGVLRAKDIDVAAMTIGSLYGRSGSFEHAGRLKIDQFTVGGEGTGTLVLGPSPTERTTDWVSNEVAIGAMGTGNASVRGKGTSSVTGSSVSAYSHRWQISGTLAVGLVGTGTLVVSDAAGVGSANGLIGGSAVTVCTQLSISRNLGGCQLAPPGNGSVTITGSGTLWQTGALTVGAAGGGRGELLVRDNGRVAVDRQTTMGALGKIVVDGGGRFETGGLWAEAGSLLLLDGGAFASGGGGARMGGTLRTQGGTSVIEGTLYLVDTALLEADSGQTVIKGVLEAQAGAHVRTTGELIIQGRALLQAGSTLDGTGATYNYGSLSLGDGFAQLADTGAMALMPGGVLEVDIGGGSHHDRYATSSWLQLGGTLKLASALGYSGHAGDRFDLLDGNIFGAFEQVDTSGFQLADGLAWDFSQLHTAGVVGIVAAPVPEPGTWALWLCGLAGLGWRQARRRATPA